MLKYLFTVQYKDGTRYEQNPADVSVKDPTKSCYFDIDIPSVEVFCLANRELNQIYAVDLETGKFAVNGSWLSLCDETISNKTLVYFRRVTKHIDAGCGRELFNIIVYHIGWKGKNAEGKEVQYTLAIE